MNTTQTLEKTLTSAIAKVLRQLTVFVRSGIDPREMVRGLSTESAHSRGNDGFTRHSVDYPTALCRAILGKSGDADVTAPVAAARRSLCLQPSTDQALESATRGAQEIIGSWTRRLRATGDYCRPAGLQISRGGDIVTAGVCAESAIRVTRSHSQAILARQSPQMDRRPSCSSWRAIWSRDAVRRSAGERPHTIARPRITGRSHVRVHVTGDRSICVTHGDVLRAP
jgi:hypothetical protein